MDRQLTKTHLVVAIGFALVLTAPRPAEACIPIPDASGLTDMNARRAVIWIDSSSFDIIFQNQYSGSGKSFAWVIPLPGVPTQVDQPTDGFLRDLDRFTAPMFEKRSCYVPCPSGPPDAGVSQGPKVPPPEVTVWQSGSLGNLDYVVLSSKSSADLVTWLKGRGFKLPASLTPLVDDYLSKGFTFFAAKLASGAGAQAAVPAVTFSFDRAKTPLVYPLRISAHDRTSAMPTLLWVISSEGTFAPRSYPHVAMSGSEHTKTSYSKQLEQVMGQQGGTTFAVEYASVPGVSGSTDYKRIQLSYTYGSSAGTEMKQITSGSSNLHVVRLRARLNPKGTLSDLELARTAKPLDVPGWYLSPCPGGVVHEQGCDAGVAQPDSGVGQADGGAGPSNAVQDQEAGGCSIGAGSGGTVTLALLIALGLVSLLSRRRRGGAGR